MPLTLSKSVTSRTECELVAATRAGDDRAFEELYAQYRDRILAFIVAKIHDHGRAEDIAQDVFMSALRRLRQTDQPIQFKPWIYEIAKNAAIDEFRRGSRAREVPLETDGEFIIDRQPSLTLVPTPSAAMESKQRLDDLRGAFGGLSENHHRLLVMRELQGMSYDEIGTELQMTRQMVESGLFRARRKLTEEYQDLATGRRCEQIQAAINTGEMRSVASLGLRERRRVSRHLAHCQPCRHHALMAGVDSTLVTRRGVAAKIAALFPFPFGALRWPWSRGARAGLRVSAAGASKAAPVAEQAVATAPFGQAAAAAVALLAIAGGAGGLIHGLDHGGRAARPVQITRAAAQISGAAPSRAGDPGGDIGSAASAAKAASIRTRVAALHPGTAGPGTGRAGAPAQHGVAGIVGSRPTLRPPSTTIPVSPSLPSGVQRAVTGTAQTVGNAVQSIAGAGRTVLGSAGSVVSHAGNTLTAAGSTLTSTAGSAATNAAQSATGVLGAVTGGGSGSAGPLSSVTTPAGHTVGQVTGAASQVTSAVGQASGSSGAKAGTAPTGATGSGLLGH